MSAVELVERAAVRTDGLSKRYGSKIALAECSVWIPVGAICALVGPNGAGKTTLLGMLAGLTKPSGGAVSVLDQTPAQNPGFLAEVGYLSQEIALWRRFSALEHLRIGARLNPRWDSERAVDRLRALNIDLDRPVGTLSGGERAQVGLSMALAKRPSVLLLDEPVAALDPLARREFLATLAQAVAEGELTVVISSHLIGDLERISDHLVLLAASRSRLCGSVETLLACHRLLRGPRVERAPAGGVAEVVEARHTERQSALLVRTNGPILDPRWDVAEVTLEDVVLAYMSQDATRTRRPMAELGGAA